MNLLKRYFILSLIVISIEVLLLFLLRKSLQNPIRTPRTFEQTLLDNNILSAALLPDLFSSKSSETPSSYEHSSQNHTEKKFIAMGLINIKEMDSSITVDLRYSTENNFLHKNLYKEMKNCFLQKDIAEKLVRAQKALKKRFPFYSLIIYDAVRPMNIQQIIWDELQVPEEEKWKYVSDPSVGSLHNYGCAVDVSIVNENGWEMDMGTPYDYFGELGYPATEKRMLQNGKLTWRQYENRKLLREVLTESGFTGISTEWWHFNGTSLRQAQEKYQLID